MEDWKAKLGAAFGVDPEEVAQEPEEQEQELTAAQQQGNERLEVVIDRKGRKGKTATIIAGFKADDAALRTLAGSLKQQLGTGGSARGGEILLQGDYRERVVELLRSMGFTRIDH